MQSMRRLVGLVAAFAAVALLDASAEVASRTTDFESPVYVIDRVYPSMKGPESGELVLIERTPEPVLLWITGYSTQIIDESDGARLSDEFMCHSNLSFSNLRRHQKLMSRPGIGARRLFTLSQGQMKIRLPKGFGIPVLSNEPLVFESQVLNLNEQPKTFGLRHRVTVEYVRDRELEQPMKALFQKGVQGLVLLDGKDGYFGMSSANPEEHGPGCSVGEAAGERVLEDPFGRRFAAHWEVPPGRQEQRTLVTTRMDLRFDTKIHYIAVHLHPFAESLELLDLTTGKTLFKSRAKNSTGRVGLESVEHFSSAEGIPVHLGHEYELVSVYENTSSETQDAMAVMFLYMHDKEFEKPALSARRAAR